MATKQNEAVAMTQKQLAGVSGGAHYTNWNGIMAPIRQRRSNRTADGPCCGYLDNGPYHLLGPQTVASPMRLSQPH